uniref:Uncharacterized protein n=1 Tax=Micrurus paraensis TaxID=1970185 RepID=A0A2D4K7L7_9SAUR
MASPRAAVQLYAKKKKENQSKSCTCKSPPVADVRARLPVKIVSQGIHTSGREVKFEGAMNASGLLSEDFGPALPSKERNQEKGNCERLVDLPQALCSRPRGSEEGFPP